MSRIVNLVLCDLRVIKYVKKKKKVLLQSLFMNQMFLGVTAQLLYSAKKSRDFHDFIFLFLLRSIQLLSNVLRSEGHSL